MDETLPSLRITKFVGASLAGVALLTALVIIPRVAQMNDFTADDGDPVTLVAVVFVASMLVPLVAVHRTSQWSRLAGLQIIVGVVACAALFFFGPSGDGLYLLPLAIVAIATAVGSLMATARICRLPA